MIYFHSHGQQSLFFFFFFNTAARHDSLSFSRETITSSTSLMIAEGGLKYYQFCDYVICERSLTDNVDYSMPIMYIILCRKSTLSYAKNFHHPKNQKIKTSPNQQTGTGWGTEVRHPGSSKPGSSTKIILVELPVLNRLKLDSLKVRLPTK